MIYSFKKDKYNCGFTLVETLVAVSIFTLSVLGLMAVLSEGLADTSYTKNKIIGAYLAQEGVEYIRNLRDTYVLYGASGQAGWNAFNLKMTGANCDQANGCYFGDLIAGAFTDTSQPMIDIPLIACGVSCATLLYDSASGKYNYTTGVNSVFIRKIRTVAISANETEVFSTVYWTKGSGTYQMTFSESLFNWVE